MINIKTNEIGGVEISISGNGSELYHEFITLLRSVSKNKQLFTVWSTAVDHVKEAYKNEETD